MMHDGVAALPGPLTIDATVGKVRVRMTTWRNTGVYFPDLIPNRVSTASCESSAPPA